MPDSSDPHTCKTGFMPPQPSAPGHGITRRNLMMTGVASAIMLAAGSNLAWAQPRTPDSALDPFLDLSRTVTGYTDLSLLTARRIHDALVADRAAELDKLLSLAKGKSDAKVIQSLAREASLGDMLIAVISAWYTGTVTGKTQTTVVAYREALMYRPVDDGLIVPTYCNKGPMWWRDILPPGVTRMPVNDPKVL